MPALLLQLHGLCAPNARPLCFASPLTVWSAGLCTDHDILKHFIQAVVLLYGAQGFGFEAWEGHETEQTLLLGATYGVFYFSAAPVTRQAYKVQQRFSSGKVAMDLLTDAYAASLVLGAVLLWLGVAPALPVVSRLQPLSAWKRWLIRMRAGWSAQLYIGLYALCKPPGFSRI